MNPGEARPAPQAAGSKTEATDGAGSDPGRARDRGAPHLRSRWVEKLSPGVLGALAVAIVVTGQLSLDFITVDDLREAEVAREMLETGSYVVPHLAGRPFVEKPPGYQLLLALAYRLAGGPSLPAARLTAALCACASLAAVFVLGRRLGGPWAGGLAAIVLASSTCFCRTAHTLLLDNALTAAIGWAFAFSWFSFDARETRSKRLWAAAALMTAGVSFLFKGFVGPAIFGAGLLGAVALTRRWNGLAPFVHPLVLPASLVAPLCWVVPFVLHAPPGLQYDFFIRNHFGRAIHGYDSHSRPFYFYLLSVWVKFAPGSLILPFAAWRAWRDRRTPQGQAGAFLLASSLGGMAILSLSTAKDDTYLLPIYPGLACLVAVWAARGEGPATRLGFWGSAVLSLLAFLAVLAATAAAAWTGGRTAAPVVAAAATAACLPALAAGVRLKDARATGSVAAAWTAVTAMLLCTPPLSSWYMDRKAPGPTIKLLVAAAGDRELLLYQPEDRLRGGCGFYRNRTALEISTPSELLDRFRNNPRCVAVIHRSLSSQAALTEEARRQGMTLEEELHVDWAGLRPVSLIRPSTPAAPPKAGARSP